MKTCKYCGIGVQSLSDCNCGEWKKDKKAKRNGRQVRHYWRHTFRRIRRCLLGNARHKDRLAATAHNVTALSLWGLAKRQKCICPLSGRRITNENISVDHIVPLSKGGTHDISNLRLTVKESNIARQSMTDAEFVSLCRDVVNHSG